jgi:hypothetical protein
MGWGGGFVYLRWEREREEEEGYWVRAGSYLVSLRRRQLSIARSSSRRPRRELIAGVSLNGHAYSIPGYVSIA